MTIEPAKIKTGLPGTFSRTGYVAPEGLSYDDWARIGQMLQHISGAVQWWIGDWLLYGERKYGEMYAQAVEDTGNNYGTLRNAVWVCSRIELSRRRDNLSFSHHQEVAALEPPDQDRLLEEAEKNGWSRHELRKKVRELKLLRDGTPPLPDGKYRVIYADPPWNYSDELIENYGAATHHYPVLSMEELCALGVGDLTAENAVLFLWATSPLLEDAFEVVQAWGFEYKNCFVWDKVKHNYGHYNSVRHELLLICTKGSCLPDSSELHDSVVTIERTDHSSKPVYFRDLIDSLYAPAHSKPDRIELFARGTLPSLWDRWGNEAGGQVKSKWIPGANREAMDSLPKPARVRVKKAGEIVKI